MISLCVLLCVYVLFRWRDTQKKEKDITQKARENGERRGERGGGGSKRKGLSEKESLIQDGRHRDSPAQL